MVNNNNDNNESNNQRQGSDNEGCNNINGPKLSKTTKTKLNFRF